MPKDGMSVVHFSSFAPVTEMILQSLPAVKDKEDQKAPAIKNFDQLRQRLNSHARFLILDLEFFQDQQKHRNGVAQIAGKIFETQNSFNYYLYAQNMSAERQLAFLRQYDLRLSEVNGYEVRQIFNRIFHFIAVERPDYIVSWDNGTDFESLNYEANRLKIRKEDRPWRTIQSLDLEKLVAKEV
ncbi:hypothetical protein [Limosilactobacillus reuteri]|nr:hypothetical protein [Limosilactobacillus reuteri]